MLYLILILIVVVAFILGCVAKKFNFSEVFGLLLVGVLFAPIINSNLGDGGDIVFSYLSKIGLFSLMFLAGFEVSWNMIKKEEKDAVIVTFYTMGTSLLLGIAVFLLMGYSIEAAMTMGLAFGITAEAVKARILLQLGKLKTKIGSLLMGTGIINDLFGVVLLSLITYAFARDKFYFHEAVLLIGTLSAFGLGIFVHYVFDRYNNKIRIVEKYILIFLVPFFFVNIGLSFDIESFRTNYLILPIVIFTATSGQMIGSFLSKSVTKLSNRQLYLVGWGMNSKGAVELAIAYIGLQIGFLPPELYSSLVVTTFVVTIIFQIEIFRLVRKYPDIMD